MRTQHLNECFKSTKHFKSDFQNLDFSSLFEKKNGKKKTKQNKTKNKQTDKLFFVIFSKIVII